MFTYTKNYFIMFYDKKHDAIYSKVRFLTLQTRQEAEKTFDLFSPACYFRFSN